MTPEVMQSGGVPETPKDRRETESCGPSTLLQSAGAVFVLFCRQRRGLYNPRRSLRSSFKSRMPECQRTARQRFHLKPRSAHCMPPERQSGDAGASPAERTNFQHGGRQLAQLGLQNLAGSGQHRDAVPIFQTAGSPRGKAAVS